MTYDVRTKTLFSSDLFGSYDDHWTLFLELEDCCRSCENPDMCPKKQSECSIRGVKEFYQKIMTSNLAAANTLKTIEALDIERIAPQHGSIITSREDVKAIIRHLRTMKNVGIDLLLSGDNR